MKTAFIDAVYVLLILFIVLVIIAFILSAIKVFKDLAEQIHTKNSKPIVIAHWEKFEDDDWNCYECSSCHEVFQLENGTPEDNKYLYCPHCGAEMKEEDHEES